MGDEETKPNQKIQQKNYICNNIITYEILTRLPVKSVLRFQSVSRNWHSNLSTPDFAYAHLQKTPFSNPSSPVHTLFIKSGQDYYLFCYNDDDKHSLLKIDLGFEVDFNDIILKLTGCCNGLICLTPSSNEYFLLWNPITRKLHKYDSDDYFDRFKTSSLHPLVFQAFEYSSATDDYKYFRISTLPWEKEDIVIVHIFSLKENKWRKFDNNLDAVFFGPPAVFLDQKLYWVGYHMDTGGVLVSFDIAREEFEIHVLNLNLSDSIEVVGGCMCKFNYNVTSSTKKLTHIFKSRTVAEPVRLPDDLILDRDSEIVGFTRSGMFFVTTPVNDGSFEDGTLLAVVNPEAQPEPVVDSVVMRFYHSVNISRFVPSLISPFPFKK